MNTGLLAFESGCPLVFPLRTTKVHGMGVGLLRKSSIKSGGRVQCLYSNKGAYLQTAMKDPKKAHKAVIRTLSESCSLVLKEIHTPRGRVKGPSVLEAKNFWDRNSKTMKEKAALLYGAWIPFCFHSINYQLLWPVVSPTIHSFNVESRLPAQIQVARSNSPHYLTIVPRRRSLLRGMGETRSTIQRLLDGRRCLSTVALEIMYRLRPG